MGDKLVYIFKESLLSNKIKKLLLLLKNTCIYQKVLFLSSPNGACALEFSHQEFFLYIFMESALDVLV